MKNLLSIVFLCSAFNLWSQSDSLPDYSIRQVDSCIVFAPNMPSGYFQHSMCTYRFWGIASNCLFEEFKLTVYNRWGESLFETLNQHEPWDTGGHSEGVYVWIMVGKTYLGTEFEMRGHLTVLK